MNFTGLGAIPRGPLEQYSSSACLCRLDEYVEERDLIRAALFTSDADELTASARQRRQSFAVFLTAVKDDPAAATERPAFRDHVWQDFLIRERFKGTRSRVTSQWAALILKEYMQGSLSVMWIDLCRAGLRKQPDEGFTPDEFTGLLRGPWFLLGRLRLERRKSRLSRPC